MIELVVEHLATKPGGDKLEEHLDAVMDALVDEGHVADCSVEANLETGQVQVVVSVETGDIDTATHFGLVTIRSVMHTAGGGTGGWNEVFEELGSRTEKIPA